VILAAGLLLLVGLGLLVAGVVTGVTALYWVCVAVCVVAAVLLVVVRRRLGTEPSDDEAYGVRDYAGSPDDERPVRRTPPPEREPEPERYREPEREREWEPEPVEVMPARPEIPAPAGEAHLPEDDGSRGAHAGRRPATGPDEAPLEEVEVTDLLLVVDLRDEVLVVDEHPRYHLPGCDFLVGRTTIPLPIDEARSDGFTPCGSCHPDRTLAQRVRARRSAES
jgi:hypothetical protein